MIADLEDVQLPLGGGTLPGHDRAGTLAVADDPSRHADGNRACGNGIPDDGARPDDRPVADADTVEQLGACTEPRAFADVHASRHASLLEHGNIRIAEIVIAADQVAIRRDQRVAADANAAGGKELAVEADVGAIFDRRCRRPCRTECCSCR